MKRLCLITCVALITLTMHIGCQPAKKAPPAGDGKSTTMLEIPKGDPVEGRVAFKTMQCSHCHMVLGDKWAAPVAQPTVPVSLGPQLALQSRQQLADSIISPSHIVAKNLANVKTGKLSRMGDYSRAMTVRQLIDIVAYVQSLGQEKQ